MASFDAISGFVPGQHHFPYFINNQFHVIWFCKVIIIDLGYVAQMQELIILYFTQAKWLYKGYVPSFDEYKSVALRSIGLRTLGVASFVDLGDFIATKDNFEGILKNAKSVKATETIVRLMDDIAGYKVNNILHSTL